MTPEQITQVIQGGQWVSITTELRPSTNKSATGEIQPFYCSRVFTYAPDDRFACTVMNYADANGKVPLVKIVIKGQNAWQGEHPIAQGAYNLDYIADEAYDSKENFRYLYDNGIDDAIKVRENSSYSLLGYPPRKKVVLQQLKNIEKWKNAVT